MPPAAPVPFATTVPAGALRWWRIGYQAGHQAAEHEPQAAARRDQAAASRQARIDALLLETIKALAGLFTSLNLSILAA